MATVKLSVPFTVKGEEVTELNLDFDKLSGNDLVKAEKEVRATGDNTPLLNFSLTYQAAVAGKIVGCPVDDILSMNAKDFKSITNEVAGFLLS